MFKKKLFYTILLAVALPLAGCEKAEPVAPDVDGTITVWLGNGTPRMDIEWTGGYCPGPTNMPLFSWNSPGNLVAIQDDYYGMRGTHNDMTYLYTYSVRILDVGRVAGLDGIKKISGSNWIPLLACEVGRGYIIRIEAKTYARYYPDQTVQPTDPDYWEGVQYARLFVAETAKNNDGVPIGAKVKYQFPFIPE